MEKPNSSKQANPVVIAVVTLLGSYCVPLLSIQKSLTFYFPSIRNFEISLLFST